MQGGMNWFNGVLQWSQWWNFRWSLTSWITTSCSKKKMHHGQW